jgi:hypothetical protein
LNLLYFFRYLQTKEVPMPIKTILTTLILTVVPGLALAQGCHNGMDPTEQAMSCLPGSHWDEQTASCVPVASS